MSRSGYSDDIEDPLALGRWRQAVKRSLEGKRGQALLRELATALDAMPDKRLFPGSFATASGEFCTLGVLGAAKGIKTDDLGDEDFCDTELVGARFGIAKAMASEIMYLNDEQVAKWHWQEVEICGPMQPWHAHPYGYKTLKRHVQMPNENHPQERWQQMRNWVSQQLK
jgi:hypothetical protein